MLEAALNLVHNPSDRALLVLGYKDVYSAADHLMELLEFKPIGLEGMDEHLMENIDKSRWIQRTWTCSLGKGWLLVEFGAMQQREAKDSANADGDYRKGTIRRSILSKTPDRWRRSGKSAKRGWAPRHVPGAARRGPAGKTPPSPPERLADYLRDLRKLIDHFGYTSTFTATLDRAVFTRASISTSSPAMASRSFAPSSSEAADLVVQLRRLTLWRAWRRPVARGVASEDVRA